MNEKIEKTNLEKEIDHQKEVYAKMTRTEAERQVKAKKKISDQKKKIFALMKLNEGVNKVFTNLDEEFKKEGANVHDMFGENFERKAAGGN